MAETTVAERLEEGLYLLRFPTVETVTAEYSQQMVAPLAEASRKGPIVLLADLPPALRLVPGSMGPFWLNAFLIKGVRVKAIGVTSTSRAVRVVLAGVEAAMKLRANPVAASSHATLAEMIAWGRAQLKAP